MAVRTWKKRIVAACTSAMLAIGTSCSEAAPGDKGDTDDEEALHFRAGGPDPAGVAAEVAQLRAQPLVLGPTTSVGTLRGDAGVSPRGSGGYTIPIEVTPGPRGMQPSLSVVYDWGAQERGAFIKEWHSRGLPTPAGGWSKYDIHHIRPREYGGTNAFDNLAPVERTVHQAQFNTWWSSY